MSEYYIYLLSQNLYKRVTIYMRDIFLIIFKYFSNRYSLFLQPLFVADTTK